MAANHHAHSLIRRSRQIRNISSCRVTDDGSRTESERCCSQLLQCSRSYSTVLLQQVLVRLLNRGADQFMGKAMVVMVVMVVMVRRLINTTHRVGQMSECCRPQPNFCTSFPQSGYIHFWKYRVQTSCRWGRSALVEDDRQAQEGLRNAPGLRASASSWRSLLICSL